MMKQEQALEIIGARIIQAHSDCWKKAWDEIRGPFNHPDHSNRIRSDLLREHAAIEGKKILPALGLKYLFDEGQHMFILPGKASFIYKKMDEGQRVHQTETDRCKLLLQSLLFPDEPTLFVGIVPAFGWMSYGGIYLCRPNSNGKGNAWALDITDTVVGIDATQSNFISLLDQSQFDDTKKRKPQPKFKPKNAKDIGESPEETGSGGGTE